MQPEYAFAWRNLEADTPHTNWTNPQTTRDKIRCEFKNNGREYTIPNTIYNPMAHDIVQPLHRGEPVVEWWVEKKK
jgi:hypothetical protein